MTSVYLGPVDGPNKLQNAEEDKSESSESEEEMSEDEGFYVG